MKHFQLITGCICCLIPCVVLVVALWKARTKKTICDVCYGDGCEVCGYHGYWIDDVEH